MNELKKLLRDNWGDGFKSDLARRLVFWTLLCGSVLAVGMTGLQLFVGYRSDRDTLLRSLDKIENAMAPALVESLWILDDVLINSQLTGMLQIDDVEHVEVREATAVLYSAGAVSGRANHSVTFPLLRVEGRLRSDLGHLHVTVSFDRIYARLFQRALFVFGSNVIKAFGVACCMLVLYQVLIGRHLSKLARFVAAHRPEDAPRHVALDRPRAREDELGALTAAVNNWIDTYEIHATRLREANREQAEFSYALSHDLKSPINTLLMLFETLRELEGEGFGDEAMEVSDDIQTTALRMQALVNDVLAYAQSVGQEAATSELALGDEVALVLQDLAADIAEASATVTVGELPVVTANAAQVRLVFQNVLANAIKFRHAARVPCVEVTARQSPDRSGWILSVRDNGIGIPAPHQHRVFGLFKRLHTYSQYQGSGVGLAVCQRIMSNLGGSISVVSDGETGTTFELMFPNI